MTALESKARRDFIVPQPFSGDVERVMNLPAKRDDFLSKVFDPYDPFGEHNSFVPRIYIKVGKEGTSVRLYLRARDEPLASCEKSPVTLPPLVMYDCESHPLGDYQDVIDKPRAKEKSIAEKILECRNSLTLGNTAPYPEAADADGRSLYYAALEAKLREQEAWIFAVLCHPDARDKIGRAGTSERGFFVACNEISDWAAKKRQSIDKDLQKELAKGGADAAKAQQKADEERAQVWQAAMEHFADKVINSEHPQVTVLKGDKLPFKEDGTYDHQGRKLRVADGVGYWDRQGRRQIRIYHNVFSRRFQDKDDNKPGTYRKKTASARSAKGREEGSFLRGAKPWREHEASNDLARTVCEAERVADADYTPPLIFRYDVATVDGKLRAVRKHIKVDLAAGQPHSYWQPNAIYGIQGTFTANLNAGKGKVIRFLFEAKQWDYLGTSAYAAKIDPPLSAQGQGDDDDPLADWDTAAIAALTAPPQADTAALMIEAPPDGDESPEAKRVKPTVEEPDADA